MTISQLRYFLAICDNDTNMTKAAEYLHISQSTLSKSINDLEEELGILIFARSKQRIRLTTEGLLLMEHGREVLDKFDELPAIVNQRGRSSLLIGIHPNPMYFMLELLNDFISDYPDINIQIDAPVKRRSQLVAAVTEGVMAAAVLSYDPAVYQPDTQLLNVLPLKTSRTVYVVSKDHPLASRTSVTYEDIAPYPIYGYTFNAQKKFATMGLQPKFMMSTHNPQVISKMLEDNRNSGIMLRELAQTIPNAVVIDFKEPETTSIAVISLKDPKPTNRRALNIFLRYVEDNKHKMHYLFEDGALPDSENAVIS